MPRKDENPYTLHMIRLFLRAETRIINELGRLRAKGLIDYHAEAALGRVQEILKSLKADGWEYVPKMVETEFYVHHPERRKIPWTGLSEPVEKHVKGYENAKLTGTQTRVAEILTRQLMLDIDEACDTAEKNLENIILGRRKDDAARHICLKYALEQEATGLKLPELTQNFLNELAMEGVTCFTDKAGREWRLSTYGAMVLRTVTAQAQVMAVLTADPGRDLYQISEIGTTCPICAPLEGRVYSRSGQDPDFPPLAWAFGKIDPDGPDTLENTWLNIHPCCLHSLFPFTTAGKTEAEIERLKRFSSFTLNPPTHDPRSEAQIQAYRDKQRDRAKHNRDLKQFEAYRAAIPDVCPKSFSTFMKHKTLRDDKYKSWVRAFKASA